MSMCTQMAGESSTCPHCSSVVEDTFPIKGFDDVIKCLQYTIDEQPFSLAGYLSLTLVVTEDFPLSLLYESSNRGFIL